MKRKVRLTYIQLCRYRRKTWLSHSVLLDAQNNHSYCSLFWRPFGKTRTNNTVYIIAAKAKLSDTHFFPRSRNTWITIRFTIWPWYFIWYVIIHSWWTILPFLTSFPAGGLLNYLGTDEIKCTFSHCSKSSFFVQKFNFDFPKKLSIFLGEKLVKMLWFWTF